MVTCPAASILHPKINGALSRSEYKNLVPPSISNGNEQLLRQSMKNDASLSKRRKDYVMNLVLFEPGDLLLPVHTAAEVLETFYTGIAIGANGDWATNTPRIWIRLTFGTIRLLMTATEGSTIPWSFVTDFALDMLKLTERGYTGLYTASFVNPTVGNAIWITLYRCTLGPLTDPAAVVAPARAASCLNPRAPSWFPSTP